MKETQIKQQEKIEEHYPVTKESERRKVYDLHNLIGNQ